jgi:hypothetical protein
MSSAVKFVSDDEKLPDFFPRAPKECKSEAEAFFSCYYANGKKSGPDDKNSGQKALMECKTLKQAYEQCVVTKVDSARLYKRFQVHEEYRSKDNKT